MEEGLKAEILLLIPNVKLYEIIENTKRQISTGELKILKLSKENIFLIVIGNFTYSLTKELSVMRSTHNQYVFPASNCFLGIFLPEETDFEHLEIFEMLLSETTDFSISKFRYSRGEIPKSQTFDLDAQDKANTYQKSRKISLFLENSGDIIKRGLVRAATFTSAGIKKGGEYIKKKIKKNENPSEVSSNKKTVIKHLKTASSVVLVLSKAIVTGAVATTKEVGKWVSARFEESKTSQKLERSHAYQMAKLVGKAGISAAVTIYDGLEEALVILGRSGADVAVNIVDHKYGEDAKEAAQEAVDALGNAGLVYREMQKMGVRSVLKASDEFNKNDHK